MVGHCFVFPNGFLNGSWLTCSNSAMFYKSIIVAIAWFIWKNRCDVIFKQIVPNYFIIAAWAFAYVTEFSKVNAAQLGRKPLLNNFSNADGPFLFVSTLWNPDAEVSGFGYFISNYNMIITSTSYGPLIANTGILAELQAILIILQATNQDQMLFHQIFTTNQDFHHILTSNQCISDRSLNH